MDLRQLRYFQAVAEEGSFSGAARRLHVSQPPLSLHVKTLENELGVRLFDRSNRGVALTPAGQAFYDETRGLLRRLEQAKLKARHAGQGEVGTLSIGFVTIAGFGVLPPALKRFRDKYPHVDVQLHELTTDAQIRELRAERLDLGIGLGPVDEADLTFEPFRRESLLLAAPVRHPLVRGSGPVSLKALANEQFVILGGAMGKTALDPNGVKSLASLPSLDELRAKIVGLVQAPATKIAQLANAPAAKVARVISAYASKDAAA